MTESVRHVNSIKDSGIVLNKDQLSAVSHGNGPCMVIAGPGSGKTAVITKRVQHLIVRHAVPPDRILTVTFTKAAAVEMMMRFHRMTDAAFPQARFGTFHALFYKILVTPGFCGNRTGGPALHFMNAQERTHLAKETLKRFSVPYGDESGQALLATMARVKNGLSPERAVEQIPFTDASRFRDMLSVYDEIRGSLGYVAYDDIAPDCLAALKSDPGLCAHWKTLLTHIQIDEYQDINPVQLQIVKLLAAPDNNVFAVGDDDQAIYGFRGAAPDVMLRFCEDFPETKQVCLSANYRSVPGIVDYTAKMINGNRRRYKKRIHAVIKEHTAECGGGSAADRAVVTQSFQDRAEESRAIAEILAQHVTAGKTDFSDTAVIFRTNAEAADCAVILRQAGLPCFLKEKLTCLYDEAVSKDVEAYLRFAVKSRTRSDFLRIMNKPVRYLSGKCVCSGQINPAEICDFYREQPHVLNRVRKLFHDIEMIGHLSPKLAIGYIRTVIGYERYLTEHADAGSLRHGRQVLDKLVKKAAGYKKNEAFLDDIAAYRNSLRETANANAGDKNGVRLLTMHAAKGLEFDTVFLPALNEGIIPSVRAGTPDEIEEERRLLYVAMTRARRKLYLSYVTGGPDPLRQTLPSSFITRI